MGGRGGEPQRVRQSQMEKKRLSLLEIYKERNRLEVEKRPQIQGVRGGKQHTSECQDISIRKMRSLRVIERVRFLKFTQERLNKIKNYIRPITTKRVHKDKHF